jgi:hypothetical protein
MERSIWQAGAGVANRLYVGISQDGVSRLERHGDLWLSMLQRSVAVNRGYVPSGSCEKTGFLKIVKVLHTKTSRLKALGAIFAKSGNILGLLIFGQDIFLTAPRHWFSCREVAFSGSTM